MTIDASNVAPFLAACEEAKWYAFDTGERVMTDEGPDAEAVLLVEPTPFQTTAFPTAVAQ